MTLDPKSLEFRIKTNALVYPEIFGMRQQAINHLYLVLGNGYDWWDGMLIDKCEEEKVIEVEKMVLAGCKEDEILAYLETVKEPPMRMLDDLIKKMKEMGIDTTDLEKPIHEMRPLTVYCVSERCAIMELPDYIRPDWLAGAEEAVYLMETTRSYDDKATEENRRLAPIVRERISVLKSKSKPQSGGGLGSMMLAV